MHLNHLIIYGLYFLALHIGPLSSARSASNFAFMIHW